MSKEMLINVSEGEECRIALVDDGKLEEIYMERTSSTSHVGNIYKGRVTNVEASIQAAFVDFGLGRNGFLHISDLMPSYFGRKGEDFQESVGKKMARRDRPPIQRCLRRGDEIVVQIIKEGIGTKGPTLSSYLSIIGRYLVMMPGMAKMGVSRKIEDDTERRRLRQILDSLKPPRDVGFIIRTAGVGATKTDIQRDFIYLTRLWEQIEETRDSGPGPTELYAEGDLVTRTVRDVFSNDVERIVIDHPEVARRVRDVIRLSSPRAKDKVELYDEPVPIFHKYGIEKEIELMHSRHVPLPSGGSLVIDSTEAVVAIDVNSGKSREHNDAETTAFRTDMEAADEITRQLRLRDLGGVIICDFIDLRYERHRRELEDKLQENFKKDKAKFKVLAMSEFGIIEITRSRRGPSLKRSVYFDCPHCKGSGLVKTSESMSLDVMRRLAIAIFDQRVVRVELTTCEEVAFYLQNKKRMQLAKLELDADKTVVIKSKPGMGLDEIKLELFDSRDSLVYLADLGMTPEQMGVGQRPGLPQGRGPQQSHRPPQHQNRRGGPQQGRSRPRDEEDEGIDARTEMDQAEEDVDVREERRERAVTSQGADDARPDPTAAAPLAQSLARRDARRNPRDDDDENRQGAVNGDEGEGEREMEGSAPSDEAREQRSEQPQGRHGQRGPSRGGQRADSRGNDRGRNRQPDGRSDQGQRGQSRQDQGGNRNNQGNQRRDGGEQQRGNRDSRGGGRGDPRDQHRDGRQGLRGDARDARGEQRPAARHDPRDQRNLQDSRNDRGPRDERDLPDLRDDRDPPDEQAELVGSEDNLGNGPAAEQGGDPNQPQGEGEGQGKRRRRRRRRGGRRNRQGFEQGGEQQGAQRDEFQPVGSEASASDEDEDRRDDERESNLDAAEGNFAPADEDRGSARDEADVRDERGVNDAEERQAPSAEEPAPAPAEERAEPVEAETPAPGRGRQPRGRGRARAAAEPQAEAPEATPDSAEAPAPKAKPRAPRGKGRGRKTAGELADQIANESVAPAADATPDQSTAADEAPAGRKRTRRAPAAKPRRIKPGAVPAAAEGVGTPAAAPADEQRQQGSEALHPIRTGSTDRHQLVDEPIAPEPPRRPRTYRDLDAIPDDFD